MQLNPLSEQFNFQKESLISEQHFLSASLTLFKIESKINWDSHEIQWYEIIWDTKWDFIENFWEKNKKIWKDFKENFPLEITWDLMWGIPQKIL